MKKLLLCCVALSLTSCQYMPAFLGGIEAVEEAAPDITIKTIKRPPNTVPVAPSK